jgi:uncharacterized protein YjbI with pentapeptide repeats
MKIEIKSRWNGSVLFSLETGSLNLCLEAAVKSGANLKGANLKGANLKGAYLQPIRDDVWAMLSSAPAEVEGLRLAIIEGRVNGSQYHGECACLIGTIANVRKCDPNQLGILKPNENRPAERFFLAIKQGDTPETNQASKIALEWVDTWLANVKLAFSPDKQAA